jgi:hypothetical protein
MLLVKATELASPERHAASAFVRKVGKLKGAKGAKEDKGTERSMKTEKEKHLFIDWRENATESLRKVFSILHP